LALRRALRRRAARTPRARRAAVGAALHVGSRHRGVRRDPARGGGAPAAARGARLPRHGARHRRARAGRRRGRGGGARAGERMSGGAVAAAPERRWADAVRAGSAESAAHGAWAATLAVGGLSGALFLLFV